MSYNTCISGGYAITLAHQVEPSLDALFKLYETRPFYETAPLTHCRPRSCLLRRQGIVAVEVAL